MIIGRDWPGDVTVEFVARGPFPEHARKADPQWVSSREVSTEWLT